MFKKPLSHLKTSAPLRSSDRRKLRQRVISAYGLSAEDGDALVPEGIMSVKFMTHVDAPGVAYLSPGDGEPLWFTVGKSADDPLLPSVYTLWKKPDMLPFLSTPAAVVPILVGGADLMIPGVVHLTPELPEGQVVAIRQYISKRTNEDGTEAPAALSAPVAVGRMALSSERLKQVRAGEDSNKGNKGKAVHVVHTWKDHLWEMGSRREMPASTPLGGGGPTKPTPAEDEVEGSDDEDVAESASNAASVPPSSRSPSPSYQPKPDAEPDAEAPPVPDTTAPNGVTYTPAEVSSLLELALIQAIATRLADAPKSLFPIPATRFYTDYILPCRPGFPTLVLPPSQTQPQPQSQYHSHSNPSDATNTDKADAAESTDSDPPTVLTDLTIKSSTHKNLSAFLKAADKAGLISVKAPPSSQAKTKTKKQGHGGQQQEVLVTAVHKAHGRVLEHLKRYGGRGNGNGKEGGKGGYATVEDVERTMERRRRRAEAEAGVGAGGGAGGGATGHGGEGGGGGNADAKGKAETLTLTVRELYAPEGPMKGVFEAFGLSPDAKHPAPEIRKALSAYVAAHALVNAGDQAYVNLDEVLLAALASSSASSGKKDKGKGVEAPPADEPVRWLRRDELTKKILGSKKLQAWHEISAHGAEPVLRKGALQPISISSKTRAGRKVVTSIAGFEPFLSLPYANAPSSAAGGGGRGGVSAEEMAEDLRKLCAGSTTVGPTLNGAFKLPGGGLSQTVTVQGKQGKAVQEYLFAKGVPKEWINVEKW